jgi:hypothetical protein
MKILNFFFRAHEDAPLMDAMIGKLGLAEAMRTLPDQRAVLRRASERCLTCKHPDFCAGWLADVENPTEAPFYCRNHDLFERITERVERVQRHDFENGQRDASLVPPNKP